MDAHGLSVFGDLKERPNFPHFAYVNPQAPKGGRLVLQIRQAAGNQNFETFNTLNIFTARGDGAAGIDSLYDTLMAGSGDEPGAVYGLVARSVSVSADRLVYRFRLRPEARFHDGTRLTAHDVAFSVDILKTKGHPLYRLLLREVVGARAESDDVFVAELSPRRSRELHLIVAGLPIFPRAYWQGRDFEAATLERPLGSGPYRVGRFEPGRYIEFERVADYWAKDLPVNVGTNNFDVVRYEYFRDRQVAFEAFKSGIITFNEEFTARNWATGYDFPAMRDGRVLREALPRTAPVGSQGWIYNTRREMFRDPRIRQALNYAFDFEWTNRNVMYALYRRTASYFQNSEFQASGLPSPEELALLEPWRGRIPDAAFGEPFVPPVSDGSGRDRALLRKAHDLLLAAGCRRDGSRMLLPNGRPFEIEFLDSTLTLQPHTRPLQVNLRRLGIRGYSRIVDAQQYQRRVQDYQFDIVSRAIGGSSIPGESLKSVYGSESGKVPSGRNIAGIDDPCVDALLDRIGRAATVAEVRVAARALDRVLRAGHYWIPMWWNPNDLVAYWAIYDRPQRKPVYSSGAPGTWWFGSGPSQRTKGS